MQRIYQVVRQSSLSYQTLAWAATLPLRLVCQGGRNALWRGQAGCRLAYLPQRALGASPACGAQVLVEGPARRTPGMLTGRTCHNKRVVFPADEAVPASLAATQAVDSSSDWGAGLGLGLGSPASPGPHCTPGCAGAPLKAGDYVAVEVVRAGVQSLGAAPLARTTAAEFVARFGGTLPGGAAQGGQRAAQRALAA